MALLLALSCGGPAAHADPGDDPIPPRKGKPPIPLVSLDDFTVALQPHGAWLVHGTWGRIWKPTGVPKDWRPYFQGQWSPTAEGWYWVSEEPWAWATYHFGRWFLDPILGWVWVPGRKWAPSWVAWRQGPGVFGWAPLGPDGKTLILHYVYVPSDKLGEPVPGVVLTAARAGNALKDTRPIVAPGRRAADAAPVAAAGD